MIGKASSKRFEGWPLDSLSMNKETGILLMEVWKRVKKISLKMNMKKRL